MNYRDMTESQMLAWGAAELKARTADLEAKGGAQGLRAAQANAETRRKAIGASREQAANLVIRANREARIRGGRMSGNLDPER